MTLKFMVRVVVNVHDRAKISSSWVKRCNIVIAYTIFFCRISQW